MASKDMSVELEQAIREYSNFLLKLRGWNATELEFEEKMILDLLTRYGKDLCSVELSTIQLMQFLAEAHAKSAIAGMGIDPFSMTPIVRIDGDEIMF
jgi:hypothetical protein